MSSVPNHLLFLKLFDELSTEHIPVIYTSESLNINNTICFAVQAWWTASPGRTGIFEIQGSNDDQNWITMTNYSVTENEGGILVNFEMSAVGFIRVQYTSTAGTGGKISANINSKQR